MRNGPNFVGASIKALQIWTRSVAHILPHTHTLTSLTLDSDVDSKLSASKSSFTLKFGTALWILTTGLQFGIGWWYSRSAVFYLPVAWFGPFTWWLSLPFAPAGEPSHAFDVMALPDSRLVRFCQLRRLADDLSTCYQSGRACGERIHESDQLLCNLICTVVNCSPDPYQKQGMTDQSRKEGSTDTSQSRPTPQKS